MDIRCVVCGEPWDSYGVTHGDMLPWEAKLFRQGAGCPSCEGEPNGWTPQSLADVENGDEDPMVRIVAAEKVADGTAPKWERPADPVHWECEGCGVEVITNQDDGSLEYRTPLGAKCRQWYSSHPFWRGTPEKEPAHTFEGDRKVCEFCLDHCADCGAAICSHLDYADAYDDGYAIQQPGSYTDSVCTECFEKYCSECGEHCDECTCNDEQEDDEQEDDECET